MLDELNAEIVLFLSSTKSWRPNPIRKKTYRKGSILKMTSWKILSANTIGKCASKLTQIFSPRNLIQEIG